MCRLCTRAVLTLSSNPDRTTKEEHTNVYLDNLVDVIDAAVEKNEPDAAYAHRVENEYHL